MHIFIFHFYYILDTHRNFKINDILYKMSTEMSVVKIQLKIERANSLKFVIPNENLTEKRINFLTENIIISCIQYLK